MLKDTKTPPRTPRVPPLDSRSLARCGARLAAVYEALSRLYTGDRQHFQAHLERAAGEVLRAAGLAADHALSAITRVALGKAVLAVGIGLEEGAPELESPLGREWIPDLTLLGAAATAASDCTRLEREDDAERFAALIVDVVESACTRFEVARSAKAPARDEPDCLHMRLQELRAGITCQGLVALASYHMGFGYPERAIDLLEAWSSYVDAMPSTEVERLEVAALRAEALAEAGRKQESVLLATAALKRIDALRRIGAGDYEQSVLDRVQESLELFVLMPAAATLVR